MTHQVVAELVGNILTVNVRQGEEVAEGDTIVVLESMKMEIPVLTEVSGTVRDVSVRAGEVVQEGDVLAVIDTAPPAGAR
jgi:acetyl-CoA carboxylase biotin carboxyl carrier protein